MAIIWRNSIGLQIGKYVLKALLSHFFLLIYYYCWIVAIQFNNALCCLHCFRPVRLLFNFETREVQKGFFLGGGGHPPLRAAHFFWIHHKNQIKILRNITPTFYSPGALEVFLDFISYSTGPLPELQLEQLKCPVRIIWGEVWQTFVAFLEVKI